MALEIDKLIKYIKDRVYSNHKQEVSAIKVQEAIIAVARELDNVNTDIGESVGGIDKELADIVEDVLKNKNGIESLNTKHTELSDTVSKVDDKVEANTESIGKLGEVTEELSKTDGELKLELSKTKKELEATKEALKIVSSGDEVITNKGNPILLPTNTQSSIANSYQVNGLTVENLIENGDFSDGTNNWILNNLRGSIVDSGIELVSSRNWGEITQTIPESKLSVGDKIYLHIDYSSSQDSKLRVIVNSTGNLSTGSSDGWSGVVEYTKFGGRPNLVGLTSATPDDWGEVLLKSFSVFNITQLFGKGNEPSKEWCDMHLANYIDGIKSVNATQRIKAVGENLWKQKGEVYDNESMLSKSYVIAEDIFKPNTIYVASMVSKYIRGFASRIKITYTDGSHLYSIFNGTEYSTIRLESTRNKTVKRIELVSSNEDYETCVIKNNTAYITELTDSHRYTPYQESNLHINSDVELRSMGNVKDVIKAGELIQNISTDSNFKVSDLRFQKSIPGNDSIWFRFFIPSDMFDGSKSRIMKVDGLSEWVGSSDLVVPKHFITTTSLSYIDFVMPQDYTRDDLLKEYGDSNVSFVLNKPTVTPIQTSGQLVLKPNGTLFSEPIKMGAEVYDGGIKTSLPIIKVESLAKFDMETGNDEEVDKSKAVIDKDKSILTHPDLKDGDMVFLEYLYDDSPIIPELEVESFNSDKVLEDKTTGDLYSWGVEIENGLPKLVSNKVANKVQ